MNDQTPLLEPVKTENGSARKVWVTPQIEAVEFLDTAAGSGGSRSDGMSAYASGVGAG